MLRKVAVGLAGLAAIAFAGPAMAAIGGPVNVTVTVTVEEIAVLDVIKANGHMTIDDPSDSFMGQPSSSGSEFALVSGDLAHVRLTTNFHISALSLGFPLVGVGGITCVEGGCATLNFGEALNGAAVLGVWPQIGYLTGGVIVGGGGAIYNYDGSGNPVQITGTAYPSVAGFNLGVHDFGIGVSTRWTRTPTGLPAAPGDYVITPLTVTIVP